MRYLKRKASQRSYSSSVECGVSCTINFLEHNFRGEVTRSVGSLIKHHVGLGEHKHSLVVFTTPCMVVHLKHRVKWCILITGKCLELREYPVFNFHKAQNLEESSF